MDVYSKPVTPFRNLYSIEQFIPFGPKRKEPHSVTTRYLPACHIAAEVENDYNI